MSGTYTKDITAKNQRMLLKQYGGKKNFYRLIRHYGTVTYSGRGRDFERFELARGVYQLIENEPPSPYDNTYDKYKYLERTIPNFNPKVYLCKTDYMIRNYGMNIGNDIWVNYIKVNDVFDGIMRRDQYKLYKKIDEEHPEYRPKYLPERGRYESCW